MPQVSRISGVVQIDGTPAQRAVRAFGYEASVHDVDGYSVDLSKSLGHAISNPETGEYTINLLDGYDQRVFVVAFDDYGDDFTPEMSVAVGDRIHPTTPNGYVWECTSGGTLPSTEPDWVIDTKVSELYGTASLIARPFYRPVVHGPVAPEVQGIVENFDPHFDLVAFLTHCEGAEGGKQIFDEITQSYIPLTNSTEIKTNRSRFGTSSVYMGGANTMISHDSLCASLVGAQEFTIEGWFYREKLNGSQDAFFGFHTSGGGNRLVVTQEFVFGSGSIPTAFYTLAPRNGHWLHVAACRTSENRLLIFFDGHKVLDIAVGPNDINASDQFSIGQEYDSNSLTDEFIGWVDEFRVTVGKARYKRNFIRPSDPFPNQGPS